MGKPAGMYVSAACDIQQGSWASAGDQADLLCARLMSLWAMQLLATLGMRERDYSF